MRKIYWLALTAMVFVLASCKDNKLTEPEDPQAPVIESASLRSLSGENYVQIGENVKFSAKVSVKGSILNTWSVVIKNGNMEISSSEGSFDGGKESAVIEKELRFALDASDITVDFVPEVILKVTNADGMFTEKTLSDSEALTVKAPEIFEELYLTDSNGRSFLMKQTLAKGRYRTSDALDGIGESFAISSELASGKPAGKVWSGITTPDAGEYGLLWIGFDILSGQLSKMIDHTVTFDYDLMADDAAQGYKVFWERGLVQDCRCEFINYPAGMKLQGDRFEDAEGNTARYTGHTFNKFEVYHEATGNWFIVKYQWNVGDAMWLTGANSSLPMSPFCDGRQINWFDNAPNGVCATSTVSLVKSSQTEWRALVYLKSNFEFKLYSGFGWAFEVAPVTSMSTDLISVTPLEADEAGNLSGNFAEPGTNFTEGLYMLTFSSVDNTLSAEKYPESALPVIQ
ncbi:MAG: hypothetical protein NC308_05090 [Clostridium sp.]|nr:hypothetical protein [Bacteroides sp.]MCM1198244.1 hypothetical protein [Clostridium sp.]